MTREQLQHVHQTMFWLLSQIPIDVQGAAEKFESAKSIIDAELEMPEEREWGIFDKRKQNIFSGSREFAESCLRRFPDKYGPVQYRTPAGPWKEAK